LSAVYHHQIVTGNAMQNLSRAATAKYQTAHCCLCADELFICKGDLGFIVLYRVYGILLCDSGVNLCNVDLLHILQFCDMQVCWIYVCVCVGVRTRARVCVICLSAWNIWALSGWIFMKFWYSIFNCLEKIQVPLKTHKTVHQDRPVWNYDNTSLNCA